MNRMLWFLGVTAAMATLTWTVSWWMVPVVAAIWAFVRRGDAAVPLLAGFAAMLAWGVLLWVSSRGAPAGSVMQSVGAAMQVGAGPLVVLTIAFPALLASSAAALVRAITSPRGAGSANG
ncbi:MAG: hypothetical protein IT357_18350 [Gemmatimonadaceae bacterium]|nr:hypothetical protein [Gemmatimonadaceae bacterium]